jgi:hypothetical protein
MGVTTFEGHPITDDTFYLCFNAHHEQVSFNLPGKEPVSWQIIINTMDPGGFIAEAPAQAAGTELPVEGRSFCLLKQVLGSDEEAKVSVYAKTREAEAKGEIKGGVGMPSPLKPAKRKVKKGPPTQGL